jgi:cyclopropane-fatty-acyl-phospholipid synthase
VGRGRTATRLVPARPTTRAERAVRDLFLKAGVTIGGPNAWDLQVHDDRFYVRLLRDGSLGFGESYMDGWWDAAALDDCLERLLRADIGSALKSSWRLLALGLQARLSNMQSLKRAFGVADAHYGIGNDFYRAMLDRSTMAYTCGYWKDATTLEAAQEAKVDLICRKAGLRPGMKVLDMGCGWGGFARYAAERYGVRVVGFSNSKEMVTLAAERCRGLQVEITLQDYRQATGTYDAVVAIGIMEHVGPKNYRSLMEVAHRSLTSDGTFVLHTIGNNRSFAHADPWVHKYIFPDAVAPSLAQIGRSVEGLFVVEDLHNFGPYYAPTLVAWWRNFHEAWPRFRDECGGDRFYRMWTYYLLGSAAISRARDSQLYQIVMTRTGRAQPACRIS